MIVPKISSHILQVNLSCLITTIRAYYTYCFQSTLRMFVNAYNVILTGSILEGPDPGKLKPIVEQAMPMLIELLKDSSVVVRDTAAWTVGRVCEILPDAVINEQSLQPLLLALGDGLTAEPRVASNVCWVSDLTKFTTQSN